MIQDALFYTELLILLLIFFQDLKYKAVNWILFPGLALLGFFMSLMKIGWEETLMNALFNSSALAIELLFVFLYFYVKMGRFSGVINNKLGIGDVMMLFALSFSFSPVNYTIFILFSLIFSLFIALLRKKKQAIPLAGYMGLCYSIFLTMNHFVINFNVYMGNLRL